LEKQSAKMYQDNQIPIEYLPPPQPSPYKGEGIRIRPKTDQTPKTKTKQYFTYVTN
jgi:hypothetical protein